MTLVTPPHMIHLLRTEKFRIQIKSHPTSPTHKTAISHLKSIVEAANRAIPLSNFPRIQNPIPKLTATKANVLGRGHEA